MASSKITKVLGREVLDSRGNPAVEAEVWCGNACGRAIAPSGASTGSHEAKELRDGGPRFGGKGVLKAVANVNGKIAKALAGMDCSDQEGVDAMMREVDGTPDKSGLGANAIIAVSMAAADCSAKLAGKELYEMFGGKKLPVPMLNIINGGKHAGNGLAVQEFMIQPKGAKSFSEAMRASCEIYHALGKRLVKKYGVTAKNVGDEGGYAPPISNCEDALSEIQGAVEECGYAKEVRICVDAAASEFFADSRYKIDGKELDAGGLADYYILLAGKYPISSLEDPFAEDEFGSFADLTRRAGSKMQIVGDDLLVTDPERIRRGVREKSCNALLLKVNQIGTVSEAVEAARIAQKAGWKVVVSHRSGETEDTFIADFTVGIGAGQIKAGAPARGERTAKYNRLLRIEGMGKAKW
ncbi:MAG: phosphopyruvate hydratase [Candidatus Bilamarchaeaceae archaeon]